MKDVFSHQTQPSEKLYYYLKFDLKPETKY